MEQSLYTHVYFIGIGGIGMSAIARYFLHEGKKVAGYDRTPTVLTGQLETEGAAVHYRDDVDLIPEPFRDRHTTLVVYTPAVPKDHAELNWFRGNGFAVEKRSEMLGHITEGKYVMAVAGTHGKTTTSTMLAWLNNNAGGGGSAFLGGISRNFGSNLVLGEGDRIAVEADEFDRSFLRLSPDVAAITSVDADHLDIYGDHDSMKQAFCDFVGKIKPGGTVIIHAGAEIEPQRRDIKIYRYTVEGDADFSVRNLNLLPGGRYGFDVVCPDRVIAGCSLGLPGLVNVSNAVAAVAMLWVAGFDEEGLRRGLATFEGVKRRFVFYINTPSLVYMDDYAHHPRELSAAIGSLRSMFGGRKITAVFQPHLYSRTKDFYREFARALSMADEVVLVPIYPARELPIEGVCSQMIGELLTVPWSLVEKEKLARWFEGRAVDVVATFGAGDIDVHVGEIADVLRSKIGQHIK